MPYSSDISNGDDAVYTQYNNLRADALTRSVVFPVLDKNTTLATGDNAGQLNFFVPPSLDGWKITGVRAIITTTSSSGVPTFQLHNVTDSVDILSTTLTVDVGDTNSKDATTAAVINTSNNTLADGDEIRCDIDVAGTGTKGLVILLTVAGN